MYAYISPYIYILYVHLYACVPKYETNFCNGWIYGSNSGMSIYIYMYVYMDIYE